MFSYILYQKICHKVLMKYQNQLRFMSILSHTGGTDLGLSRPVSSLLANSQFLFLTHSFVYTRCTRFMWRWIHTVSTTCCFVLNTSVDFLHLSNDVAWNWPKCLIRGCPESFMKIPWKSHENPMEIVVDENSEVHNLLDKKIALKCSPKIIDIRFKLLKM